MAVTSVQAVAIRQNELDLSDCPREVHLNCANTKVQGTGWAVPQMDGMGVLRGYNFQLGSAKPSTDSVKVIRLLDIALNQTSFIVIADASDESAFVDRCNACCGDTPVMPVVVIPVPILEGTVCPTIPEGDAEYNFVYGLPSNPNSLNLIVAGSFNGAAGTPAVPAAGFASAAALETWLNANWSAYGVWDLNGDSDAITLTSETTTSAGVTITLVPKSYCFTWPGSNTTVDGIKIGGVNVTFPQVIFSSSNKSPLLNALNGLLIGTFDSTTHDETFQYTGGQVPQNLTLAGANVGSTTFTAGACTETFNFTIPTLGGGQHYAITTATFNGVTGTPSVAAQDFVSAATMLTWVNTNWSAYGTWTLQSGNTILRLVSLTVNTATVTIVSEA